jgi:hypothetical protein
MIGIGSASKCQFTDPGERARSWQLIRFRHFCSGSLALASLNHTCRNLVPTFSATFTTVAFDDSSSRWLEIRLYKELGMREVALDGS